MDNNRKIAKYKLLKSTKTEFNDLIDESNVAAEYKDIAFLKLVQKESYISLAFKYHCSPERIRDIMREVYDHVFSVIRNTKLI